MKALVLYYSKEGGNTEKIAKRLAEGTGADIERIETILDYNAETVDEQGKKEVDEKYMPPIKQLKHNVADYDVVMLGTPTWWYSMAPAIRTFLSSVSVEQKIVILFQTHAGRPGNAIGDMRALCKGAVLADENIIEFDLETNELKTDEKEIDAWIKKIKDDILWS